MSGTAVGTLSVLSTINIYFCKYGLCVNALLYKDKWTRVYNYLKKSTCSRYVSLIILQWLLHRLPDCFQRGKVDHAVDTVLKITFINLIDSETGSQETVQSKLIHSSKA
jgi:hypothetical protein